MASSSIARVLTFGFLWKAGASAVTVRGSPTGRTEALEYISQFYTRVGERYNLKRGVALADARAAAAVAAYIYISPKRNDWYCMEVADGPLENKIEERNVIVFGEGGTSAVAYWQRFKNSAAFQAKGMLPLKEEIPLPLATLLWSYHTALKSKGVGRWLFLKRCQ